jgi:hypothetical protein
MIPPTEKHGNHREENEMYGLAQNEVLQPHEENGREVAMEGSAKKAREDRETEPYVVRDLSRELARYLEIRIFPESASATSDGASRRHGWT